MPQGTDEAGNVWELDAQGNPVRFISHGQQTVAPNQMKVQGAQLDNQNAQVTLQQKQATLPYDVRSAQAGAFNAEKAPEYKQYDNTLKLRSDFDAMPTVKEYRVGIAQLAQALKTQPDATGDNALIYAYAKAMDPGSVVRESEMTMASRGASVFDAAAANLKKQFGIEGGGQLPQQVRDRMRQEVITKVTQMSSGYDAQRQRYIADAQAFGIDPVRVVGKHDAAPYLPVLQEYSRSRNAMAQDTTGVGNTPLAGGGDDRKTIPPPPEMQAEYEGYVAANRGRLDPQAYAQFRAELQDKYGFGNPGIQPQYVEEASRINDDVAKGRRLNLRLPGVDAAKTGFDKVKGYGLNNPVGAAVTGALSLGGGLDELSGGLSAITGGDYTLARDQANAARQSLAGQYPGETIGGNIAGAIGMGYGAGRAFPALNGLVNSGRGAAATGAGYGGVSGALENNDNRFMGGVVGAGAGAAGGAIGAKVIAPGLERLGRTNAGQSLAELASGLRGKITRNPAQFQRAPQYGPGEASMAGSDLTAARGNIWDAADLGLPYSLADADPKLQALAGAVTRKSINARSLAENTFDPRALAQADRATDNIDNYLAPITDIEQRSKDLLKAGNTASSPYYALARGQSAQFDPEIMAFLETPAGKQALRHAHTIAANEGRNPSSLGFTIDDTGNVGIASQQGRYAAASAPNEMGELDRTTVAGWNGQEVPKVGPTDLVGWLRQRGGLADQGGELSHMGLTNNARKGMDFIGREGQFGPLVNNQGGASLDDAALSAWEAGYFPEMTSRPSVNEFLDAVRATHEGRARRFLPQDSEQISAFNNARDTRYELQQQRFEGGAPVYQDMSVDAGPRPTPPMSAYGEKEVSSPTFETLDLVKRGLDQHLNDFRDPLTRQLDLQGNPQAQAVEGLRQRFVSKLDSMNADYPKARAEYAKYAKRSDALTQGFDIARNALPQRKFDKVIGGASDYDAKLWNPSDAMLPEMQRGYATAMADNVNRIRTANNPFEAIFGSPNQQQKVSALFPAGADKFKRAYELERQMAKTRNETLGGSPTAGRLQADTQISNGMLEHGVNAAGTVATGGWGLGTAARALLAAGRLGVGKAGERNADKIAPVLFNTENPADLLKYIDQLSIKKAGIETRKKAYARGAGLFGAVASPAVFGP